MGRKTGATGVRGAETSEFASVFVYVCVYAYVCVCVNVFLCVSAWRQEDRLAEPKALYEFYCMRGPIDPPMQVTINWRYCGAKTEDTAIDKVAIYIRPGKQNNK